MFNRTFVTFLMFGLLIAAPHRAHSQEVQSRADAFKAQSLESCKGNDLRSLFMKQDFGPLFTRPTNNSRVMGFRGSNYERLRVKILSVKRSPFDSSVYQVSGKTNFKGTLRDFTGTLTLQSVYFSRSKTHYNGEKTRNGRAFFTYSFEESGGTYTGVAVTRWVFFVKENQFIYDDVQDRKTLKINNEFVGTYKPASGPAELCHWGDEGVPMAPEFCKLGVFAELDPKYVPNGWQSWVDCWFGSQGFKCKDEQAEWWK